MTHEQLEVGMKVIPHSKSYAGRFETSMHYNRAKELGQEFLYINAKIPSKTQGYLYILGVQPAPNNGHAGDFYYLEDFKII